MPMGPDFDDFLREYNQYRLKNCNKEHSKMYTETYAQKTIEMRGRLMSEVPGSSSEVVSYSNPQVPIEMEVISSDFYHLVEDFAEKLRVPENTKQP